MTVDWAPAQVGLEDSLRELEGRLEVSSEVLARAQKSHQALLMALIDTRAALTQIRSYSS